MSPPRPDPETPEGYPADRLLAWPPPGLERLRGDIWSAIRSVGMASAILVFPLLWSVGTDQPFWSLGPFGTRWWIVVITTLAGIILLGEGLIQLVRLLRRSARASDQGYGWMTILEVAVDGPGDTGFLVQGARAFSALVPEHRRILLLSRVLAAVLYLAGALWVPVGFVLGILLGSRGVGSAEFIWLLVAIPAGLLVLVGSGARFLASRLERAARRKWFQQAWARDLEKDDVEEWIRAFDARVGSSETTPGPGARHVGTAFRAGAGVIIAAGALVVLSLLSLAMAGAISPILATISLPRFAAAQERAARVEPFRQYRLRADRSITSEVAGGALQALAYLDPGTEDSELMRPPPRTYAAGWFPSTDAGGGGPTGIVPARWSRELLHRAAEGLSMAERRYLRDVARHPAHREIEILARAGGADIAGGRWETPFPDDTRFYELSLPRLGSFRRGAYAHVGRAALELANRRPEAALQTIREVISAGLLVADRGPTILDNLAGFSVATVGGEALQSFFEVTGREEEAASLQRARQSTDRAIELTAVGTGNLEIESTLRALPRVVTDRRTVRGIRWEHFSNLAAFAPCMNLHRIVFGPDEDWVEWVKAARSALVTSEAEAELFRVAGRGLFGAEPESGWSVLGTVLTLPMGGRNRAGSCAAMLSGRQEAVIRR